MNCSVSTNGAVRNIYIQRCSWNVNISAYEFYKWNCKYYTAEVTQVSQVFQYSHPHSPLWSQGAAEQWVCRWDWEEPNCVLISLIQLVIWRGVSTMETAERKFPVRTCPWRSDKSMNAGNIATLWLLKSCNCTTLIGYIVNWCSINTVKYKWFYIGMHSNYGSPRKTSRHTDLSFWCWISDCKKLMLTYQWDSERVKVPQHYRTDKNRDVNMK